MALGLFSAAAENGTLESEKETAMYTSTAELDELSEMRENIRRSVQALELCWSCQRVSECEQRIVDDSAPVWLCRQCQSTLRVSGETGLGGLLWPSAG